MRLNFCSIFFLLSMVFLSSCYVNSKASTTDIEVTEEKLTLWTIMWSPDGRYIATGGRQGSLTILDGKTFKTLKSYPIKDVILSRVKWHPRKNLLAVITQSTTFKAKILNLDTDEWTSLQEIPSTMRALDWNPSGELLAVSELEDTVSIFNIDGQLVSRFRGDEKGVTDLAWHPTEDILLTVGTQIGLFNTAGDTLKAFIPFEKETFMLCAEWHKSGKYFVVGDYGDLEKAENKSLTFWNKEGEMVKRISGSKGEYRNIRWNQSGDKLAAATDRLTIYGEDGSILAQSESTSDYIWGIDWSPDGKHIISSSSKGVIILWDEKAQKIRQLEY